MSSAYSDLGRPPLSAGALARALVRPGGLWTEVRVLPSTGSTNTDVAAAAAGGAPEGLVLLAEQQVAGKGRLGRTWTSPPRAGLHVSVLLRPGRTDPDGHRPVPPARYGWLTLLAAVALRDAVHRLAEVSAAVKWPNDLLVGPAGEPATGKCAGILAEMVPDPDGAGPAVVLGVGLNVTLRADELPRADATSLTLAGGTCTDRDPLLRALLRGFADWYGRYRGADGDPVGSGLAAAYRLVSGTLGGQVRVELPDGGTLVGRATDVDDDGRLIVTAADGRVVPLAAGDVTHLRPAL